MSENVLYRTKVYTIGPMEYADGSNWRTMTENALVSRNIVVFNPYKNPFIGLKDEGNNIRLQMRQRMQDKDYDPVTEWAKSTRRHDLNLVDRSDFIIAYIIPNVASWGTAEELSTAVASRKPIFMIMQGGKDKTPLWLMGQLKHKYIYNSVEEVLQILALIDDGKVVIDSPMWRLLKKEYR
jgi:nucleoside 2-deoxyribosyltransferase